MRARHDGRTVHPRQAHRITDGVEFRRGCWSAAGALPMHATAP